MAGIFVSYRRDDSQGFAGRLADDLTDRLGPDRVFRDIEIPVGSDFTDVLHRAIATCDILLVVIGRRWAAESDKGYGSRLFEPTDWVRAEIEAAFAQDKQVVPVLVGGAYMPGSKVLPESIQRLARLQAASLSDRRWDAQVEELAGRLRNISPSLGRDDPVAGDLPESPAEILRELGERVFREVESRRRPRLQPPRLPQTFAQQLWHRLWSVVKKILTLVVLLGLIYVGLRLFGDDRVLGQLDAFEARLAVAWERLQAYIAGL